MKRFTLLSLAATFLVACQGDVVPTDVEGIDGAALFNVSDGAHDPAGNPDFFFLPPLADNPNGHPNYDPAGFNPDLVPTVHICEGTDETPCADPVVDAPAALEEDHYQHDWKTAKGDAGKSFRIRVFVAATQLGFVDVDLTRKGGAQRPDDPFGSARHKAGSTLPIKFRIEEGAVVEIVADGAGRQFGPLPAIPYALADNTTGEDIYPLGPGSGALYLFGLFDTGTTKVRLFNEIPYFFNAFPDPNQGLTCNLPNRVTDGNFFGSDAFHLGLTSEEVVRVRLNGLAAIDPVSLGAPIGLGAAQLEVPNIPARPEPTNPSQPMDVTLIGGEINQSVVASIDYTTAVQRSGYDFYPGLIDRTPGGTGVPGFSPIDFVEGPDITFYSPGDPSIPTLPLELSLTRIGVPAVRYALVNMEFRHGANSFTDQDPAADPPINFLFDTGTTITLIGDRLATALGLAPGTGTFSCLGGAANGYVLDAIQVIGQNGTYTVNNASVCWREVALPSPFLTAIVGSNLFDQVPIVFDGAGDRLWIGEPTATPITWSSDRPSCN